MNRYFLLLICSLIFLNIACVPYKSIRYVADVKDAESAVTYERQQKKILPFDNLYIKILSTDDKAAKMFNFTEELRTQSTSNVLSYSVDEHGDISFPFAGNVNVKGLTLAEANLKIQQALSDYIPNTAVIVKFYDNKITVIGEVQREGEYGFTQDKATIYEAIAMAGGMTRFGNRKRVILIREEEKKIKKYILDLSNSNIIGSPYYYLLPRDVIVIEPIKAVSWSYQNMTYSTILASIGTLLAGFSLYYTINFKK